MYSSVLSAQDLYISYNKTYAVDTIKIKEHSIKRMENELRRQVALSGKDCTLMKQVNNQIDMTSSIMFASMNESVKHKRKDITIENGEILFTDFFDKNGILEQKEKRHKLSDVWYYDEKNLLKVWEQREKTKNIMGYDCFQVHVVFAQTRGSIQFSDIIYWTLYVTPKIKIPHHPIVNFKSLLDQYYPLEIVHEEELLRGFVTTYTLRDIKE